MQRNARKQHVQYLHNLLSHTKCSSPWRSITIKLFSLQPYQPISKFPYNKASACKRHTYSISNSHKPHRNACLHKGIVYVYNNISPSHPTLNHKRNAYQCTWTLAFIPIKVWSCTFMPNQWCMHMDAYELLPSYPTRYEAASLCPINDGVLVRSEP